MGLRSGLSNPYVILFVAISAIVLLAAVMVGYGAMDSAQSRSGTDQGTDINNAGTGGLSMSQQLTFRSDLSGNSDMISVGQPAFMQLNGSIANLTEGTIEVNEVVHVRSASADDVEVRTFERDAASTSWVASDDADGVHGTLLGAGKNVTWAFSSSDSASMLFFIEMKKAGNYNISVTPYDNATGRQIGRSVNLTLSAQDNGKELFEGLVAGNWSDSSWLTNVASGTEMSFTVGAKTTDQWKAEAWNTYYNWTVTVIDPDGMKVGGDLGQYNTGASTTNDVLNSTSVTSAWENGYNTVFYTIWDKMLGDRLSGSAAMTPTGKELTYASGAFAAWTNGSWTPQGAGHLTFHQAGHYLVLISLSKNGESVSAPLLLETIVT